MNRPLDSLIESENDMILKEVQEIGISCRGKWGCPPDFSKSPNVWGI